MKKTLITCVLAALAGVAGAQTYVTNTVPDGGFEPADPTYADTTNSPAQGGGMVIDFPATGGNPDGCARIADNSGGSSWGVWVIGNGTPVALTDMGLSADTTYTFFMDMKTVAGATAGGLKIESWGPSGKISDSGDMRNGSSSSSWQTFSYSYHIAPGATGIKLVGLWGAASTNLYDNVRVAAITSVPLSAAITYPADSSTVWTNFIISADASVIPGMVTNVAFYSGASLLGNLDTAPFLWAVNGEIPPGPAALTVVAQDDSGNSVTSAVVNVTVQSEPLKNTLTVDPTQNWVGYMNVYETPQNYGGPVFDQPWGVADLSAAFSGVGSASVLTLKPAPINDTNSFWYDYTDPSYPVGASGAVAFKDMAASLYVEVPASQMNGHLVTFSGTNLSATLLDPSSTNLVGNGWTCVAFIKDLANDYSSGFETNIVITNGATFSLSLQTLPEPNRHIQYGFRTRGPNVWPTDVNNYGSVVIAAPSAATPDYPTNNAPTPAVAPGNVLSMYNSSGTYTDHGGIGWYANWSGVTSMGDFTITQTGAVVKNYNGLSYSGVEFYNPNQIDATPYNTLHVDVWTTANQLAIKLVSTDNGAAPEYIIPASSGTITSNQWVSLDIPLSSFTSLAPNLDLANLDQMLFVDNGDIPGSGVQLGNFYIDNVYFYSNAVTPPVVIDYPTNNAPTPTAAPGNVLSMYNSSGTYTDHGGIGWYANWSGVSSMGDFTITNTGSIVKSYRGLSYSGVEFYNPNQIDATPYNTLHVDVWTTANQLAIKLVSTDNGAAPEYIIPASSGTITSNQWVSLDIPLSSFTSLAPTLDLANLNQMLFVDNGDIPGSGVQLGNFYIDNVYFHSVALIPPSVAASASGGNMQLSFATQLNRNYRVQYKTNLTDAVWQTLTNFTGTGSTVIISDPQNQASRFYRTLVQ